MSDTKAGTAPESIPERSRSVVATPFEDIPSALCGYLFTVVRG